MAPMKETARVHEISSNMQVAARNVDAVRRNAEGIATAAGEIDISVQKVTAAARAIA